MKIYHGLRDKNLVTKPRSIAIGIFDGVHRGHQKILRRVLSDAKAMHTSSMVVTFDPHPNRVLKKEKHPPILMSLRHRLEFFEKMGVSETLVVAFTRKFSKISRETFLKKFLIGSLGMKSLVVGHDFCFGRKALGDTRYLKLEAKKGHFYLTVVSALQHKQNIVSSTSIRNLIEKGDFRKASQMLGRPVSVSGTVQHGRGRGKSLGFPTANLNPHHETLPPNGVYAAWGILNRQKLKSVIHIGARPTFGEIEKSLEVHFLGFHGSLYGQDIELMFVKRLRDIKKFKNSQSLVRAIQNDIKIANKLLT